MDQEDWGSLAVHSMPMSSDSRTELTTFLEVALELATHFLETWLDLPSNTSQENSPRASVADACCHVG